MTLLTKPQLIGVLFKGPPIGTTNSLESFGTSALIVISMLQLSKRSFMPVSHRISTKCKGSSLPYRLESSSLGMQHT
jgi:hypothetical protein